MKTAITRILSGLESGCISRREAIAGLTALIGLAASQAARAQGRDGGSPFQAVDVNHVALTVRDIPRSRDFYRNLLGIPVASEGANSCFLELKRGFLALFRGDDPGLAHYCFSVEGYQVEKADELLKKEGLKPRWPRGSQRIYFDDPDGIEVQLASPDHRA